ncbi:MAG: prepilin-type N-terminal cleavage/methylation domain-containing protein [Candidatus Pacebacteria bacterium]|nr:prepilin-type N-terminal cleavage/methylation domain-containing protein [Candidatus Paceibacterota bacterium]
MNKSFTLIEILVVIVIIGIISGFIIVSMAGVSSKASIAKGQVFANSLRNSLLMDLISEWKFDGNVNDYWGVNNGTIVGTPAYKSGTDCVYGQCLEFNGTGDYVNLTSVISLSGELTFSAWAFRDTNNTYDFIAGSNVNTSKVGFNMGNDKIFVRVVAGGDAEAANSDNASIGKWHYIVVTRNSGDKVDSYVDAGSAKRLFADLVQTGSFVMDRFGNDEGGNLFDGRLDNINIYDWTVSISRIQENYYSGLTELLVNEGVVLNEFNQRISELKFNLANNE